MRSQVRIPRLSDSLQFIAILWVLFIGAGVLVSRGWLTALASTVTIQAAVAVAVAAIGTLVWTQRSALYHLLTSATFGVSLMSVVAVATVFGTLIVQKSPAEFYASRYGSAGAAVVLNLGLNDIFHTAWFNGFLGVLGVSLILVAVRRKAWRPRSWGFFLSHVGVSTILVGGLLGNLYGFKGYVDLHEGQMAVTAQGVPDSKNAGEKRNLGFAVRLDDFNIEEYTDRFRLYVYQKKGEGYRATASLEPGKVSEWKRLGVDDLELRVNRVFPDFLLEPRIEEAPDGQGRPAVRIEEARDGGPVATDLFAGGDSGNESTLAVSGVPVRFLWDPPSPQMFSGQKADQHRILLGKTDGTRIGDAEISTQTGSTVTIGAYEVRTLGYFPDFTYDTKTRSPSTRSANPNNPAVQVAVRNTATGSEETTWLFARIPDFGHGTNDGDSEAPHAIYRYTPGSGAVAREIVVVGSTKSVMSIEDGRITGTATAGSDGLVPAGLPEWAPAIKVTVIPSARKTMVPGTKSAEWKNPAVEVDLRDGPIPLMKNEILTPDMDTAMPLPGREAVVAFQTKSDDVKQYHSRLSVLEGGRPVLQKTIGVNDPLSYKGYSFYQANFRRDDPGYSGLQVVRDPGLPFVYTGLVMMVLGVIVIFYVHPSFGRRETPL